MWSFSHFEFWELPHHDFAVIGSRIAEVRVAAVPARSSAVVQCRAAFLSTYCGRKEKKTHYGFLIAMQHCFLRDTMQEPQKKQTSSEFSGDHQCPLAGGRMPITPSELRRSDAVDDDDHFFGFFVHNSCMSHLGCSRPVWHHLCSPAACS